MRGGGQPLSPSVLSFFEPRFGRSFRHVRVHKNAYAAEVAKSMNARAFTLGQDIVFGAGQFEQAMGDGKSLLAHELSHILQQQENGMSHGQIQRRVRRRYVSCWHPSQAGHGGLWNPRRTGDEVVNTITAADARAITVAENAENQISNLRANRGNAGYVPPVVLRDAFRSRFNIDVMTVSDRQLELIQRRFRRVREILEGGWIRYTCRGSDCEADDWGYADEGIYRIHLCNRFYSDTANERGGSILHEVFHIYFPHIEDWEAPALANAHCYEQFARLLLGDAPATDPCI